MKLKISSNSHFRIVGRDRFRLAFRTLNEADFEQILGSTPAQLQL